MTIIDTSVLIDYLAGRETRQALWLERSLGTQPFGLTDLILYEILQGVRDHKRAHEVQVRLRAFEQWATLTEGLEVKAAANYRSLRQRGITVRKAVDCLVATFCIQAQHQLLHNDRDFDPFEEHLGLKVVHP